MSHKLQNYLRMHRKRSGLSQEDTAFLFGTLARNIGRYEQFIREPNVEVALVYEMVFGVPARELFLGMFERIEKRTRRRAALLIARLEKEPAMPGTRRKLDTLQALLASATEDHPNI